MKRSITSSVLVFAITVLIGTVLTAYGDAKAERQGASPASVNTQGAVSGYWAQ